MSTANIERRRPIEGSRFADMTGRKFGKLTAIKHIGFVGKMAVWLFRCDCGNEVERRSSHVKHAVGREGLTSRLHCGCDSKLPRHGLSGKFVVEVWRTLRSSLCERWRKSCSTFNDECYASKPRHGFRLAAIDDSKPIGPDNFKWCPRSDKPALKRQKLVELLIADGATREEAAARVQRITRERVRQLLYKYEHPKPPKERSMMQQQLDKWLNGELHIVRFKGPADTLKKAIYSEAAKRSIKVKSRFLDDVALIKATKGDDIADIDVEEIDA